MLFKLVSPFSRVFAFSVVSFGLLLHRPAIILSTVIPAALTMKGPARLIRSTNTSNPASLSIPFLAASENSICQIRMKVLQVAD
ncbi:MAG: hypothetical protein FE78DRAFT_520240 [Acidomyces sp. 'richmondensis']|nr:MAG: hypothetical protein FE78DRAFT_520240 [Acidomyces sp. 'richmondensis']